MVLKLVLFCSIILTLVTSKIVDTDDDMEISDVNYDAFLDSYGFIEKYGYIAERHPVITSDGYIINLFRIRVNGPPVVLAHGLADSSDEWLVLGPKQSLAYQLADAGFDVWLYNSRGNRYSKGHSLDITKKDYWNFTFEEMGTRDMPATIDYILEATMNQKLSYVGFSQGTLIFNILCCMKPEYNEKIVQAVLLAPIAWVSNIIYPYLGVISQKIDIIKIVTDGIGLYEMVPFRTDKVFSTLNCFRRYSRDVCTAEYYRNYGLKNSSYLSNKMVVAESHLPAGISANTLVHYIQCYKSKRFQRYDYGPDKNLKIYSSKTPPLYNVSLITAPISMIASEIDWLSTHNDVMTLKSKLPNILRFKMLNKSLQFSHIEFVYGNRINKLINKPVLKILLEGVQTLF